MTNNQDRKSKEIVKEFRALQRAANSLGNKAKKHSDDLNDADSDARFWNIANDCFVFAEAELQ